MNRVILLVLDGFGIGALTEVDGADRPDTLGHLAAAVGGLRLPTLETLGLGNVGAIAGVRPMTQLNGCFGRLQFATPGSDSIGGHWELCGVMHERRPAPFLSGIPREIHHQIEQALGRKIIGVRTGTAQALIAQCADEHLASGAPIVWTDGGWTCTVAAHVSMMPQTELYQRCRDLRKQFAGKPGPQRVIACPISGEAGALDIRSGRKDFMAEPPSVSLLDVLSRAGQMVMGVGKVHDLFGGRGVTRAFPAATMAAALEETSKMLAKVPRGLLYVSVDGCPDDPAGAATAWEDCDRRIGQLCEELRAGDLLVVTGDHGRDVTLGEKTPTREYVPLLTTGPKLAQGVNLGTRVTAADLGQTIAEALKAERLPIGESFYDALCAG